MCNAQTTGSIWAFRSFTCDVAKAVAGMADRDGDGLHMFSNGCT